MAKTIPQRMCVGCREMKPKRELLRIVKSPEGELHVDRSGKMPGRGAYLCSNGDCLQKAIKSHGIERALEIKVPDAIWENVRAELGEDNGK